MQDIATLGLEVDSRKVKTATSDLDRFGAAAQRAETGAEQFGRVASRLAGILASLAAAAAVRGLVQMADSWAAINDRLALFLPYGRDAQIAMEGITKVANSTYAGLKETATGFIQNTNALSAYGLQIRDQIGFQQALNDALQISGAVGDQFMRVQTAISRALDLGTLRGEELNAVIESGGRIQKLLADYMGVSVTQIRQLGIDGKITGDVLVNALVGGMAQLRAEAAQLPPIVSEAFTVLSNKTLEFVGTIDRSLGASQAFAAAIIDLANNLDRVAAYAAAAAVVFAGSYAGSLIAATVAAASLTGALRILRLVMISTGIGALVVIIGELIVRFMELAEEVGGVEAAMRVLKAAAIEIWERIGNVVSAAGYKMQAAADGVKASFLGAFASIASKAATVATSVANIWNAVAPELNLTQMDPSGIIKTAQGLDTAAGVAEMHSNTASENAAYQMDLANAPLKAAQQQAEIEKLRAQTLAAINSEGNGDRPVPAEFPPSVGDLGGGGSSAVVDKLDQEREARNRVIEGLQYELAAIGQTDTARRIANETREAGVSIYSAEGKWIAAYVQQIDEANRKTEQLSEVNNFAQQTLSGLFDAVVDKSKNATDAVGDLIRQLGKMAINRGFQMLLGNAAFGASPVGGLISSVFGIGAKVPGFANGGDMLVGGTGGTDSQLVAFRATPNETVSIRKPGQSGPGGQAVTNHVNIAVNVPSAAGNDEVKRMVAAGVSAGLRQYDQQLPQRLSGISRDPKFRA